MELPEGTHIILLAPLIRGRKGEYSKLFEEIAKEGFARVRVDGEIERAAREDRSRQEAQAHDRGRRRPARDEARYSQRLADSVETTLAPLERHRHGALLTARAERELTFSEAFACVYCGLSFEELAPRLFSFNSPFGACPLQRPGREDRDRSVEGDPRSFAIDRARRDRAVEPQSRERAISRR